MIRAVVLGATRDAGSGYHMYDVGELSIDGAFLCGQLLLELEEEVLIELRFPQGAAILSRARVLSVERGQRPGVRVSWVELAQEDRKKLEEELRVTNG
jgi:hypothetical protein